MALTLVEAAKLHASNGDYRKAGITMSFAASTPLLGVLPIVTLPGGNAYSWNEEGILPTAAYRSVNGSYTASEGKFTPRVEALKIVGGTLDVDRAIIAMFGADKRASQEALKAKAVSQQVGYSLIHGDAGGVGTSSNIDGLANRFPIGGTRDQGTTAGALSMKRLDQAIDETSSPTHILLNRAMARNITAYLRGSGTAIQMGVDQFGRRVQMYNDLPFVIADPVDVDTAYQALPFTEASSTSSMFVMSLGTESLHLIQNGQGLFIEDLRHTDGGTSFRTLVEWYVGLVPEGPRCVTRLSGLTNATATA